MLATERDRLLKPSGLTRESLPPPADGNIQLAGWQPWSDELEFLRVWKIIAEELGLVA